MLHNIALKILGFIHSGFYCYTEMSNYSSYESSYVFNLIIKTVIMLKDIFQNLLYGELWKYERKFVRNYC